jgi:hypothetical protein
LAETSSKALLITVSFMSSCISAFMIAALHA